MTHFTPGLALAGGAMIGAAAGMLWLGIGRIAGISGIVGNAATSRQDENDWRWVFLLGLLTPPVLALLLHVAPAIEIGRHLPLLAASGLLVGVGTRLGSGCTSGHGVCGISRGSPRSIAATLTFMTVAIVVVFLVRHVFHLDFQGGL
jgi:uncharacterized membrane protein YedE/YeeE